MSLTRAKKRGTADSDSNSRAAKRVKKGPDAWPPSRQSKEAETDSDPILESDTTSQSGEDDGASWPRAESEEEFQVATPRIVNGSQSETNVQSKGKTLHHLPVLVEAEGFLFTGGSTSSREAHAKQKVLAQERKNAKPNADSIARSKKLWEKLRRKSHVEQIERKKLVAELFEIITGRVSEFVSKHDTVRVIQTALKYANPEQRRMIAKELKGQFVELAKGRYSKFLIGKILVLGDEEARDLVIPEFYGQVRRLINHPEASWILDDIYRGAATRQQKASLLREWYGAEFALFKQPTGNGKVSSDLRVLLDQNPEKRSPVLRALHDLINQLVQKKTTGFTMLHDAMLQYYLHIQSNTSEATEFLELLKGDEEGDLLKNLAFTESGARLVCLALAHGTAKDRKRILRVYKDLFQTLAYDLHGHQVILTAYEVVDDTVMLSKSILSELTGGDKSVKSDASSPHVQFMLGAANNLNARTALLYPFSGRSKAILSEQDSRFLSEISDIRKNTSKKDPEVRRKELLSTLSLPMLGLIAKQAEQLCSTSFGCRFIGEVILSSAVSASDDRLPAMKAMIDLSNSPAATATISLNDSSSQIPLLQSASFGRLLKSLVLGGKFDPKLKAVVPASPPLGFDELFFSQITMNDYSSLIEWATGPNSFVVVALLEAAGFSKKNQVKSVLMKNKHLLEVAAGSPADTKVGEMKGKRNKKRDRVKAEETDNVNTASGNPGTSLLLRMLSDGSK